MRILLYGYGRMGREFATLAQLSPGWKLVAIVEPLRDEDLGAIPVLRSLSDYGSGADILVDFSHPHNLDEILTYAVKFKVPVLLATTGYSAADKEKMHEAAQYVPVMQAGNTGRGIAVLQKLAAEAAALLPDWDIEIMETHHRHKKDNPSGTALMLAESVQKVRKESSLRFGRLPGTGKREEDEIGMHSLRGGSVFGEHKLLLAGQDEYIEISHTALSRKIFASGALYLAEFLVNQPPGFYSAQAAYEKQK